MNTEEHVCEYLNYEDQWVELVYPGTQYQRRVLMSDRNKPVVRLSWSCSARSAARISVPSVFGRLVVGRSKMRS